MRMEIANAFSQIMSTVLAFTEHLTYDGYTLCFSQSNGCN